MIIGIDYTSALHQGGGIGRYTRELVRTVVGHAEQHQFCLFYAAHGLAANANTQALHELCAAHAHVRAVPIPFSPRRLTQIWQRLRFPMYVEWFTGPLDLLHAPDFVLPPTKARTLLTVHDLSFLVFPDLAVPSMARYLSGAVPRAVRRANAVLADSLATKRDIVELLGAPAANIDVVYPGLSAGFTPRSPIECAEVRARCGLPRQFLVFVSTLSPRKNVVRLIEAFNMLVQAGRAGPDTALILIGQRGWLDDDIFATIERVGLGERLRWLRYVEDADLPAIYSAATATVYPSLYEGFGLPALEAMACGSPVITANNSSLPEVVGAAAVLVEADSVDSIATGIERVLCDESLRQQLHHAGRKQAQQFTWKAAAAQVVAHYEQLGAQAR